MKHFASFPTVEYTVAGQTTDLVDITRRVQFLFPIAQNDFLASDYQIKDGETPQSLAYDFYGDATLDWIILNSNNMVNPFYDWPLGVNELNNWLTDQFGNPDVVYLYTLPDGRQFFQTQQNNLQSSGLLTLATPYTYRDYYGAINEAKRTIRVIQPNQISTILNQFNSLIST